MQVIIMTCSGDSVDRDDEVEVEDLVICVNDEGGDLCVGIYQRMHGLQWNQKAEELFASLQGTGDRFRTCSGTKRRGGASLVCRKMQAGRKAAEPYRYTARQTSCTDLTVASLHRLDHFLCELFACAVLLMPEAEGLFAVGR